VASGLPPALTAPSVNNNDYQLIDYGEVRAPRQFHRAADMLVRVEKNNTRILKAKSSIDQKGDGQSAVSHEA
jgi:hypothetical protein